MAAQGFPVGFMGKLPIFPDFINYNAAGREARALHQWFQEGLYAGRNKYPDWPEPFDKMPRFAFLFNAGSLESYMVGSFGPSEDQSGRKYPFTVFSIVVQKKYGATLTTIPLAFNEFFIRAQALINGGWATMDAKRLTNWAEGSTVIPMFQDFKTSMQTMTLESYFKAVTETFESDRKYLIFNNLMVIFGQLRNQNTQRFSLGLQLPLSRQSRQWSFESAVWLEIIFGYLGRAHSEPVFFWNLDSREDQPYLFLFLRPPPPRFLIHLIRPDLDSELVCNLSTEGMSRIAEIKQKMNVTLKNWLDSPAMTLIEFIGKFSTI